MEITIMMFNCKQKEQRTEAEFDGNSLTKIVLEDWIGSSGGNPISVIPLTSDTSSVVLSTDISSVYELNESSKIE